MSIRVMLNDRVLYRPLTGVGHYTRQLLAALRELPEQVDLHVFMAALAGAPREPAQLAPKPVNPAARQPRESRMRQSWAVRRVLQSIYRAGFRTRVWRYALYHEPNHIPIRCAVPTVTTIHDLSALAHPDWHPDDRLRWYERDFEAGVRQTRRFIAASEFTKRDMIKRLGIDASRIDVTYQAPRPSFTGDSGPTAQEVCRQYELPRHFFLFVGTLEPRKNVVGLLEAYAALPADLRARFPLVLAGGWGWKMEQIHGLIAAHGIASTTRLLGYVHDQVLAGLYAACTALVWPTFYEGFGLPPLEAMACSAPVITSAVTSLPEVVGNAGVLLDPRNTNAWTESMRRMAEDDDWRADWQQRGAARAAQFSWRRCAEQTIDCYRRALDEA